MRVRAGFVYRLPGNALYYTKEGKAGLIEGWECIGYSDYCVCCGEQLLWLGEYVKYIGRGNNAYL